MNCRVGFVRLSTAKQLSNFAHQDKTNLTCNLQLLPEGQMSIIEQMNLGSRMIQENQPGRMCAHACADRNRFKNIIINTVVSVVVARKQESENKAS